MDLSARKYNFIQEVFNIDMDVFEKLERILKKEKVEKLEVLEAHKLELDKRLEEYKNEPNKLIDWDKIKDEW